MIREFLQEGSFIQRIDGKFLVGWGKKTPVVEAVKRGRISPVWYSNDFFLTHTSPWYHHEKWAVVDELDELIPKNETIPTLDYGWGEISELSVDLESLFTKIDKIVLYRSIQSSRLPSVLSIIKNRRRKKEASFFGTWERGEGCIGATPERLFEESDEKGFRIWAIAGTYLREKSPTRKEIVEHEWVVKGIVESLSPFGKIVSGDRGAISYGPMDHLTTLMEFERTQEISYEKIISRLHPTAALGGYPKEESLKILGDYHRRYPRKGYGAPFGYCLEREIKVVMAIRTLFWDLEGSTIYGGAGITAQSHLPDEMEEMAWKIAATCDLLQVSKEV